MLIADLGINHQRDADQRDKLFAQQDMKRCSLRAFSRDNERSLKRMEQQLADPVFSLRPAEYPAVQQEREQAWKKCQGKKEASAKIDIAMISGVGFERHLHKGDSEIFVTTLAEIDKVVDEGRKLEQDEELEAICQKLPEQYREFADVFSKTASDTLPLP
ncbi:hypothetical protein SI65_04183 [Aspergillus cristatus]|nr:hypothetical protein SI65_09706 [Aspergillus cristatus]ODM15124.1 hypothetical protein SI65_09363 [Aspergillus cristatus]ODM16323.1 hypothetical protein SI65_08323 [Aspergillus cristatus]ODM21130.1 hypothetical protein SI65_04183 [Aspergillus cristatus]